MKKEGESPILMIGFSVESLPISVLLVLEFQVDLIFEQSPFSHSNLASTAVGIALARL